MMRRVRLCAALLAALGASRAADAQERTGPTATATLSPIWQRWTFATPITQDTNRVHQVEQTLLPMALMLPFSENWRMDIVGGYAIGSVELDSVNGKPRTLELSGPTDVRVRLTGRMASDHVILTLGVNAPSGKTKLTGPALEATQILGAPGLRMPAAVLGNGFGATAGLVVARRLFGWAVALGSAYELRNSYSPIEATISGVSSPTDLDPGDAIHISLGADRVLGNHRLAFAAITDIYGQDRLSLTQREITATSTYKLGRTTTVLAQADLAVPKFSEFGAYAQIRHRAAFEDANGVAAEGSSGNVFEAGVRTTLGKPRWFGLILRGDALIDSGLEIDDSMATAAMNVLAGTVGIYVPMGSASLIPYARFQNGTMDTGPQSSSVRGLSAGVILGPR
jgi:hypothetical protein